jgi:hypothetical protein
MSALAVKFPGIGRNFARILKVYNHLIYWYLQGTRRKIMLFSMFLGCKPSINALPKSNKLLFIPNGKNVYK